MKAFADHNPIAVTVYFLAVTGIAMFTLHPVLTGISLCGALAFCFVKNGFRQGKSHLYFLGLFVVLSLLNPLVSHRGATVLFVLNHNPITLEALCYGVCAAANLLAVLYWLRSFSEIMTSDKLLYMFAKLSPKLSLVLSMALRYVALFAQQAKKIAQTQKALGLYGDNSVFARLMGAVRVFSVLLTWALENGIITADSMAARGYGIGKRSSFAIFRFRRADVLLILLTLLCFAIPCIALARGDLGFDFYPMMGAVQGNPLGVGGLISYAILAFLPVFIHAKEAIVWNYSLSKI